MLHTHAKYINETMVEFPPINDNNRGIINYFTNAELLEADGYLPFIGMEYPTDGKNYNAVYEVKDGIIYQSWQEVASEPEDAPAIPAEEQRRQAYLAITDGMEAELAYKTRKGYPVEELKAIEDKIDEVRAQIKKIYPDDEKAVNTAINNR